MLLGKQLTEITEDDLGSLVDNEVAESRELEYKLTLPGNTREERVEFLADVVAFANSAGGVILYGVDEKRDANGNTTGIPREVSGLSGINIDEEIRRLDNIIRDGVDPRIIGLRIHPITLTNGNVILALEVPRSWNAPHAVDYQRRWRFYYRDSAGKHPMDVSEVRNLFNASEGLLERIRDFRAERLFKIAADETPVPIVQGAKLALHLIPLEAFRPGQTLDLALYESSIKQLFPVIPSEAGWHRYNIDGVVVYALRPDYTAFAYTQAFRNGVIESVDTLMLSAKLENGQPYMPTPKLEQVLARATRQYLNGLTSLGVLPPLLGYITLLGVQGYKLARMRTEFLPLESPHPIDRDILELPEMFIEDLIASPEVILKPAFDGLWNAVGWSRCAYYDENGEWTG
jgi:hypothetical protein